MARAFTPKVITGNALLEGDVIYLDANGAWTRELSKARIITDENLARLLLLEAEARANEIVGPYLADIADEPDGPAPVHFREAFRRTGPSNYHHGKQAEL